MGKQFKKEYGKRKVWTNRPLNGSCRLIAFAAARERESDWSRVWEKEKSVKWLLESTGTASP